MTKVNGLPARLKSCPPTQGKSGRQTAKAGSHVSQNARPFDCLLDSARSFGKTGQAMGHPALASHKTKGARRAPLHSTVPIYIHLFGLTSPLSCQFRDNLAEMGVSLWREFPSAAEQDAEKLNPPSKSRITGAEALLIRHASRGAEAPLFHRVSRSGEFFSSL